MARTRTSTKSRPAARRGGTGTQGAPTEWWQEAVEVPRADTENARKAARRTKFIYRYCVTAAILFPIACIGWIMAMGHSGGGDAAASDAGSAYAATKPIAMDDVTRWLATNPSPLPGGHLVSWDSAQTTDVPDAPGSPGSGYDVETHHLTLADADGSLYDSTVTLVINPGTGASVAGDPTLVPEAPSAPAGEVGTIWPGLAAGNADAAVQTAVSAWAAAMSSGDPQQLATAIGDGNNPAYMPLVGATLSKPDIAAVANLTPPASDGTNSKSIIVRVDFDITWKGVRIPSGSSPATVTYDLRLDYDSKGNPVVDAWGGAGEGPTLQAYGNAVPGGRTLVASGGLSTGVTAREGTQQ